MINLYRDPQGERIFDKSNLATKLPSEAETKIGEDLVPLLQKKVQEQEEVIEANGMKIRALQEIINTM